MLLGMVDSLEFQNGLTGSQGHCQLGVLAHMAPRQHNAELKRTFGHPEGNAILSSALGQRHCRP